MPKRIEKKIKKILRDSTESAVKEPESKEEEGLQDEDSQEEINGIEDNAGEDSQEEQINTTQIKLNLSSDLKMLSSVTPGTLKHFQ
jgi:hypothetical protein